MNGVRFPVPILANFGVARDLLRATQKFPERRLGPCPTCGKCYGPAEVPSLLARPLKSCHSRTRSYRGDERILMTEVNVTKTSNRAYRKLRLPPIGRSTPQPFGMGQNPKAFIFMFAYLQVLDLLTTLIGLHLGAAEASPFIRVMMHFGRPAAGVVVSKLCALLLGGICAYLKRRRLLRRMTYWYGGGGLESDGVARRFVKALFGSIGKCPGCHGSASEKGAVGPVRSSLVSCGAGRSFSRMRARSMLSNPSER